MKIHFFEEFPGKDIYKAKLLKHKCIIFLAAKSYAEFQKYAQELKTINPLMEPAYWPILPKSYWLSPFSFPDEINKLFLELSKIKLRVKILIDLELPILHPILFKKNLNNYFSNKALISKILNLKNINIFTAEYVCPWKKYSGNQIPMCYSSMTPFFLKSIFRKTQTNWVGLGAMAKGIFGWEPIISPQELDFDLDNFKKRGISNAVIFRLGGLNDDYLKVINKYL